MEATIFYSRMRIEGSWAFTVNCTGKISINVEAEIVAFQFVLINSKNFILI